MDQIVSAELYELAASLLLPLVDPSRSVDGTELSEDVAMRIARGCELLHNAAALRPKWSTPLVLLGLGCRALRDFECPLDPQKRPAQPSERTDLLLFVIVQGVAHAAKDYTPTARVNVLAGSVNRRFWVSTEGEIVRDSEVGESRMGPEGYRPRDWVLGQYGAALRAPTAASTVSRVAYDLLLRPPSGVADAGRIRRVDAHSLSTKSGSIREILFLSDARKSVAEPKNSGAIYRAKPKNGQAQSSEW
jgi:hypothetical protein